MTDYDRALTTARETSVLVPEFEAIAKASERERERWTEEDRDVRARARRWLWLAAAAFLAIPLFTALEPKPWQHVLADFLGGIPLMLPLLGAAWLTPDRRLRSAILARALMGSGLVFALLGSLPPSADSLCIVSVVVAVASGRSLQLLGERDLDGSEEPDSSFEPVRFRGVLLLALVMACADASTLLVAAISASASLIWVHLLGGDDTWWTFAVTQTGLTMTAAALMAINVWGLWRLRTWALFSSMLTNLVIAALVLSDLLAPGALVSIGLLVTAGIQLLLPLPILAVALGLGGARRWARFGSILLRVVVPAIVLATIVSASIHFSSKW